MSTISAIEQFEFKAETRQLLHLMIHALYTKREIFLRELISNASDALDRLRYESMLDPSLLEGSTTPEIRLDADPAARTLTIHDTGIGMSRQEVIDNLGTIARSGTQALVELARRAEPGASLPDLIGQFGVGFYSAFMVADRVTVLTRRVGEQTATSWDSTGDGHFTVSSAARATHGTSVTLHLQPASDETGVEDYTDHWILTRIVKRHSDFVSHPIVMEAPPPEGAAEHAPARAPASPLNSQKPLWTRPPADVSESEYAELYKALTGDWREPMLRLAVKAEGRWEYQALLFVPSEASPDLFYHGVSYGLHVYAQRVLVAENCPELLPRYLRFVKGIVDAMSLPLNISRQLLQESRHITQIRTHLAKKILARLTELFESDRDAYMKVWRAFGRALKEGVGQDYENKERLLELLLFASSRDAEQLTTLREYVGRMPPEQQEIYYLTGESREALAHAPQGEAIRERGFEILYLTDPVDELVIDVLPQFEGHRVRSLGKGAFAAVEDASGFETLIARLQARLDAHVKLVRLSDRLRSSPACFVREAHEHSPFMERLLLKGKGGGPRQRPILELNPKHPIVIGLRDQLESADAAWDVYVDLLFGYASLSEGADLAEPIAFTGGLLQVLEGVIARPGASERNVPCR
jgi:molecular chaperone HtpG